MRTVPYLSSIIHAFCQKISPKYQRGGFALIVESFQSLNHRRKTRSYQQTYCLYSQYVFVMQFQIKTTSCYVATVAIASMENISIFLASSTNNCQITAKPHGYVSGVKLKKSRNHLPVLNKKEQTFRGTEQVYRE